LGSCNIVDMQKPDEGSHTTPRPPEEFSLDQFDEGSSKQNFRLSDETIEETLFKFLPA